jgi:GntR family transcriptional regulator
MSPAAEPPKLKKVQVADALRDEIGEDGKYKPGMKLPTQKELEDRFGFAGQTIQNGLEILRSEGLIISFGNQGNFVAGGEIGTGSRDDIDGLRSLVQELTGRVEALEKRVGTAGS